MFNVLLEMWDAPSTVRTVPILFGLQVGGAPIIYPLPPWKLGMIPPTLERNLTGRNGPTVVDFGRWKGHLKSSSVIPWIYCIISWRLLNHQNTCVFLCRSNRGSPSNSKKFLVYLKVNHPWCFFPKKSRALMFMRRTKLPKLSSN